MSGVDLRGSQRRLNSTLTRQIRRSVVLHHQLGSDPGGPPARTGVCAGRGHDPCECPHV